MKCRKPQIRQENGFHSLRALLEGLHLVRLKGEGEIREGDLADGHGEQESVKVEGIV